MILIYSILILTFLYLIFTYGIRWFIIANEIDYIREHGERTAFIALRDSGYRVILSFIKEYLLCLLNLVILAGDYAVSLILFLPWFRSTEYEYLHSHRNPVILIHGYMMRASTLWLIKRRLIKEGWRNVYIENFFPPTKGIADFAEQLRCMIERLEEVTGKKRFNLICHSMGGLIARYYITHSGGEKIERLITIGTPHKGSRLWCFSVTQCGREMRPDSEFINSLEDIPEEVFAMSIYSDFDELVIPNENAMLTNGKCINRRVEMVGHLSLVYSKEVYLMIRGGLEMKIDGENG